MEEMRPGCNRRSDPTVRTPVRSPDSNGVCEAFVKTCKRDTSA